MTSSWVFMVVFLLAFAIGLRSSIRIARTYRAISGKLAGPERLIAFAFVLVACVVTAAAGWYGSVSALRLAGVQTLFYTPLVSILVATCVLALPPFLDFVLDYVARTVAGREP